MVQLMKRSPSACSCHAYGFPHRAGGGACLTTHSSALFCGCCGLACSTHEEDQGIGHYEYWGRTGVHRDIVEVSDCCDTQVYDDPREIPKKKQAA